MMAFIRSVRGGLTPAERALLCTLILFDGASVLYSIRLKNWIYALSSFMSLLLLLAPCVLETACSVRISLDLKGLYYFLVIGGPVLGNVYKFYHYIRPWDKLLHFLSGFGIAAVGYALPDLFIKGEEKPNRWFKCLFSLCFSLAAGAVWEIYEYLLDVYLKMDMQNDTVITEIASYMLGETPGSIGTISDIKSVHLNGEPFEKGYIDIGLIDTMKDLIKCALGSGLFLITTLFVKPGSEYASIRRVGAAA